MSTNDQDSEESSPIKNFFKEQKVGISYAIKKPFPFLEGLRDQDLITQSMYEHYKEVCGSFEAPMENVVYKVLCNLEEAFDIKILEALFSDVNMKEYPGLTRFLKSFQNAFQFRLYSQIDDGEKREVNASSQLTLEQGTGENYPQGSLTWPPSDPSTSDDWSNYIRNTELISEDQMEDDRRSSLPTHSGLISPANQLCAPLCDTPQVNGMRREAASEHGDALERGAADEPQAQEPELADIMMEKSSFHLEDVQQTQARTNGDQESDIIVISSEDSDDGGDSQEPSTSGQGNQTDSSDLRNQFHKRTWKRLRYATNIANSSIVGKNSGMRRRKQNRHGSYGIRNIKMQLAPADLWKGRRTLRRRRKRGPRIPKKMNADFSPPELPVTCGEAKGTLYKEKLQQGTWVKSIKSESGRWLTPREFEIRGGHAGSKNWKLSVRCYGWTLKELIEKGHLPDPPKGKKKLAESRKCRVCRRGRRLYRCSSCRCWYHKNCHIPPVETQRHSWSCVFCKTKAAQTENQGTKQCYEEREILWRRMSFRDQLKCELLLLRIYCYPASAFFASKPHRSKEFPNIKNHMWLNKIKNRLNNKRYDWVHKFVSDMRLIFKNHRIYYKDHNICNLGLKIEARFEKMFRIIFSIRDARENLQQAEPNAVQA